MGGMPAGEEGGASEMKGHHLSPASSKVSSKRLVVGSVHSFIQLIKFIVHLPEPSVHCPGERETEER